MPKRMLDDTLLSSPSLARCSPRAQDAFPRLILLMDDFGCAEANPRVLLGRGWPLRDDVSERDVWGWLEEYVAAGMACLWTANERRWVHLTGWFGPHGQKRRDEYGPTKPHGSKRKTPTPPADLVAAVVAGARRDHDGKPPGIDREGEPENTNDSVPARETAGNPAETGRETQVSREFPAPAVPVAVAVPVATTTLSLPRRPSPGKDEDYPLTAAVLAICWDKGWEAAWPKDRVAASQVEAAVRAVGVESASGRLLAMVAAKRAAKEEPRPWLGWHVDTIQPKAERQAKSSRGPQPVSQDFTKTLEDVARELEGKHGRPS